MSAPNMHLCGTGKEVENQIACKKAWNFEETDRSKATFKDSSSKGTFTAKTKEEDELHALDQARFRIRRKAAGL